MWPISVVCPEPTKVVIEAPQGVSTGTPAICRVMYRGTWGVGGTTNVGKCGGLVHAVVPTGLYVVKHRHTGYTLSKH